MDSVALSQLLGHTGHGHGQWKFSSLLYSSRIKLGPHVSHVAAPFTAGTYQVSIHKATESTHVGDMGWRTS